MKTQAEQLASLISGPARPLTAQERAWAICGLGVEVVVAGAVALAFGALMLMAMRGCL